MNEKEKKFNRDSNQKDNKRTICRLFCPHFGLPSKEEKIYIKKMTNKI